MWLNSSLQQGLLSSGHKPTLPAQSSSKRLLLCRPQLQSNRCLQPEKDTSFTMGYGNTQVSADLHSTVDHLTSRHMEVSLWQTQIAQSRWEVDREITAVEQVRGVVEGLLQERRLYSQLISDCMAIRNILNSKVLTADLVLTELRKEEQLTSESIQLLQEQMIILLKTLSSLKEMHTELHADLRNKDKSLKRISECITCEVSPPSSRLQAAQHITNHVSSNFWMSHNKTLKLKAEDLVRDSSSFRRNLQLSLANLQNAQKDLRCSTEKALQRKIHELKRVKEALIWEKQQINEDISHLTRDMQNMAGQMRSCESRLRQTSHCLDILNQRPRVELCLDPPHVSLTLQHQDLCKVAFSLHLVLKRSQQDLDLTQRRLMVLEGKLAEIAHTLEVEQKCLSVHQSFLPAVLNSVIVVNKARLHPTMGGCRT